MSSVYYRLLYDWFNYLYSQILALISLLEYIEHQLNLFVTLTHT